MIATFLLVLQAAPQKAGFPGLPINRRPTVEIAWNRLYDTPELYALFDRVEKAYPALVHHEVIGHSVESREMRVYTLCDPSTGSPDDKPAMWIDGNVHGNEVQCGEAVLYALWYLCENFRSSADVTQLVEGSTFYFMPTQNPDGRAHWFEKAHNPNSSRTGVMPHDDDGDGLLDEDPPNDLDGDGNIVQMRKYVPGHGTHRLDPDDPRFLIPVAPNDEGRRGDWILLGEEGIDDDGDGRVNEDPVGGYDMNRAWPSMWEPEFVQDGAGPYPLYWPEPRCVAEFLLAHPNVAAMQSFHNAGGMILRGPGAQPYGEYERDDVRVFDEIGKNGERMLPFYKYMVIWKDLYTVWGGFSTWGYEGLGVISFTNEMWNSNQYFGGEKSEAPRGAGPDRDRWFFDDKLVSGEGFVDWHPFHHPQYGDVEIGGFAKDTGRVPPTFMVEEMVHRNAMFCLEHARHMPLVVIEDAEVHDVGGGTKALDVVFRDLHLIPTRTAQAAKQKIGAPDVLSCSGAGVEVVAGGIRTDRWRPEAIELVERDPARIVREQGLAGRGELRVRWFLRGDGAKVTVRWSGEKAKDVVLDVTLH